MKRFLFNFRDLDDGQVVLPREESHHISHVLRFSRGDEVELFDGKGGLFRAELLTVGKRVRLKILEEVTVQKDSGPRLWVCQGDLKGKKMDVVVQKCTELGVHKFFSFTSSRSQGRASAERLKRRHERWQKTVESACKQSGRLVVMDLAEYSFTDLLRSDLCADCDLKLLFWEEERNLGLAGIDWQAGYESVSLMLGPEGGFSSGEVEAAQEAGWKSVSLGTRILRAETATITSVSIVQHRLGNL